jgi:hypothetical protein
MTEEERLKRNAYMRDWKKRNKKKVNKINKNWKDKNRTLVRNREREYARTKAGTGEGYRQLWLQNCKYRAKKKGLPFNLTLGDLVFPDVCPVLGIPLVMRSGSFSDNSPSIDRTIPSKGYVKGNVGIMSYRANRIKCHASLEDLEAIVAYMRRVQ